ncbi:MAG: PEP-CTERM sorting domain-containing protein [Pseudomonadota bacterium]
MKKLKGIIAAGLLMMGMSTAQAVPVSVGAIGALADWEIIGPSFRSGGCAPCAGTWDYDVAPGAYSFEIFGILSAYSLRVNGNLVATGGGIIYFHTRDFTAVPEPSTLALFGLGLLGFGVALRRKNLA